MNAILWAYLIAFLVSVVITVVHMTLMQRRSLVFFSMLLSLLCVAVGGYWALAASDSIGMAHMSIKLIYLSGCFMPVLCFLNIAYLCKVRIPSPIVAGLIVFCTLLYFSVLSIGHTELFYATTELVTKDGVSTLLRTYGPMHTVYNIQLIAFNACSFIIILVTVLERNNVSKLNSLVLFGMQLATLLLYLFSQRVQTGIEWMPFLYVLIMLTLFILMQRFEKYDIEGMLAGIMSQYGTKGIAIIDKRKRYMGCNTEGEKLIPALTSLRVDRIIADDEVFENLDEHIAAVNEGNGEVIWYQSIDGNQICINMFPMHYRKKMIGYMLYFMDDTQQQETMSMLNDFNDELTYAVNMQTERIQEIQSKIIFGVAELIENRDNMTGGHVKRTSDAVSILVDAIQSSPHIMPAELCENIIKAAPMHDLGKIAIDDAILKKKGRFTPEEFEQMKAHSASGAEAIKVILGDVEDEHFVETACNIAHYHHERWDGNGYPDHLKGEEIPIEARIMALADVFDALVSKRAYKEAMSYDTAFGIIEESLGTQFDPNLGRLFLACRPQLEAYYDQREDLQ